MANATVYVLEEVNMICGNVGGGPSAPGISTHLTLSELKLPGMEEAYVDHMPGGAPVSIEVPMHINRLECTFNLAGFNPDVMRLLGSANRSLQIFTANGLVRDRRSGEALKAQAVIQGRLGRVNPTNFQKSNLFQHEFSIRSIVSYKLDMQETKDAAGMTPIYQWDFFTSDFFVGDTNMNADMIRILGIPTVSAPSG